MTKDVLVTICGLQNGPETDGEPIEMTVAGEYFYKNNKHYILYDEVMEGETQVTKNRIKISEGQMELTKHGVVNVNMIFEKDKKNIAFYQTPMGTIEMDIAATRVMMAESEKAIEVQAEYALGMNGSAVADCVMNIRVTPQGDKENTTFFK